MIDNSEPLSNNAFTLFSRICTSKKMRLFVDLKFVDLVILTLALGKISRYGSYFVVVVALFATLLASEVVGVVIGVMGVVEVLLEEVLAFEDSLQF